jgi:hypothetical protein
MVRPNAFLPTNAIIIFVSKVEMFIAAHDCIIVVARAGTPRTVARCVMHCPLPITSCTSSTGRVAILRVT